MNELGNKKKYQKKEKKLTCDPQIHFSFHHHHHQNAFQPQPENNKIIVFILMMVF